MTADVQLLKTIGNIKSAIELGDSTNLAADVAKLVAMAATATAVESVIGTYSALNGLGKALSEWRLGKAVSGHEADIVRSQALAGLVAAELVGMGIDYVNDWSLGSRLYDYLHPSDATNTSFTAAQRFIPRRDPLTLDLNNNGIETTAPNATNPILFDHTGDGIKTGTGWISPSDGFLALDRNGNGSIDSGQELFGDSTPLFGADGTLTGKARDGFDALAQQDSNGDGIVNALDANFANLRVWQDLNQDGVSQAGELKSLAELGINVSNVAHSQLLANGNQIADTCKTLSCLVSNDTLTSGVMNDEIWRKAA